jgi:hypothetical protein
MRVAFGGVAGIPIIARTGAEMPVSGPVGEIPHIIGSNYQEDL